MDEHRRKHRLATTIGVGSFFILLAVVLALGTVRVTRLQTDLASEPPAPLEAVSTALEQLIPLPDEKVELAALRARPRVAASPVAGVRILAPAAASTLPRTDLLLVKGIATPRQGEIAAVELSLDGGKSWQRAHLKAKMAGAWYFGWAKPPAGTHKILARAWDQAGPIANTSSGHEVTIGATWTTPYLVQNPYAVAGTWRQGQLHTHSANSFDGNKAFPPPEKAFAYKRAGYNFVVLTDHDILSGNLGAHNDDTFLMLPGYESTGAGHINALFVTNLVPRPSLPPQDRIDRIRAAGGLVMLNHPDWPVGWTGDQLKRLTGYNLVEIYNKVTTRPGTRDLVENLDKWRQTLNYKGLNNKIWGVAVNDSHDGYTEGGWVMAKTEQLTPEGIKAALARGSFYASNGATIDDIAVEDGGIHVSTTGATTIRFIDQDGRTVYEASGQEAIYQPTGRERWVRVEVQEGPDKLAWSQPLWLVPNAPTATLAAFESSGRRTSAPMAALQGRTVPRASVAVYEGSMVLARVQAEEDGRYSASLPHTLKDGRHELRVVATDASLDRVASGPTRLLTRLEDGRWLADE